MKKIILILTAIIFSLIALTGCGEGCSCEGCGNNDMGMGNYTFNYVHIFTDEEDICLHIKSWKDSEVGIEVKLDDGNTLFISENRYLLSRDYCPICK